MAPLKIYFDGGCRPNPGAMETAVVIRGQAHIAHDLGNGSSMAAEWLALIAALEIAQASGAGDFVLLGDSAAVVDQANGVVPCRNADCRPYLDRFRTLAGSSHIRIRRIKRQQNLAGIALAGRHAG